MQKNTVLFVVFSTVFLVAWYVFFQPAQQQVQPQNQTQTTAQQTVNREQDEIKNISQDKQIELSTVKDDKS